MARNQLRLAPLIGLPIPATVSGPTVTALSAASNASWYGFSFIPSKSKTISEFRYYQNTPSGTVANISGTCTLYSNDTATGKPNASVQVSTAIAAGSWPSGGSGTAVNFTGFSTALTAGTRYWAVLKTTNAASDTHFPNIIRTAAGSLLTGLGSLGWSVGTSADTGATWALGAGASGFRIKYSDGSFEGLPIINSALMAGGSAIFASQEVGMMFTMPLNCNLTIKAVRMPLFRVGAGALGDLRYKIYTGTASAPALLGTTNTIPRDNFDTSTQAWAEAIFTNPVVLPAGEQIRVVASDAGAGVTNSLYYRPCVYTAENDADSLALIPFVFGETMGTRTTNGGTSFTDTPVDLLPFFLIPDTDLSIGTNTFVAASGGSSVTVGGGQPRVRWDFRRGASAPRRRLPVFMSDSLTQDGKTGLAFGSVTATYWLETAGNVAGTAITLAAGTRGTYTDSGAAGTGGGWIEKDAALAKGWYELSIPDAVVASTTARWALIVVTASGCLPSYSILNLLDFDPNTSATEADFVAALLNTVAPGSFAAGTVGYKIGLVDTSVSSRATTAAIIDPTSVPMKTDAQGNAIVGVNLDKVGYDLSPTGVSALVAAAVASILAMPRINGTVVSDVGNSTTRFKTDLSQSTDNFHGGGAFVLFTGGVLAGQCRKITGYSGGDRVIQTEAFTGIPNTADPFGIINQ